jgi:hypothetical protein
VTQRVEDIPFDLKHRPHIPYDRNNLTKLRDDLKKRVKYLIRRPEKKQAVGTDALEYYVNGINIIQLPNVNIKLKDYHSVTGWTISVGVHNSGESVIDISEMGFGFVYPSELGEPTNKFEHFSVLPKGLYMAEIPPQFGSRLLPGAWVNKPIQISNHKAKGILAGQSHPNPSDLGHVAFTCSIRIFSELPMRELQFTIWIQ